MSTFLGWPLGTLTLLKVLVLQFRTCVTWWCFLLAGKSHLRKAIAHHEESVREVSLCKKLRNIELLQEVLAVAQQRSQLKYTQHQEDDDLLNLIDAADIICECQVPSVPCVRGRGTRGAQSSFAYSVGAGQTLGMCWVPGEGKVLLLPISLCLNPGASSWSCPHQPLSDF